MQERRRKAQTFVAASKSSTRCSNSIQNSFVFSSSVFTFYRNGTNNPSEDKRLNFASERLALVKFAARAREALRNVATQVDEPLVKLAFVCARRKPPMSNVTRRNADCTHQHGILKVGIAGAHGETRLANGDSGARWPSRTSDWPRAAARRATTPAAGRRAPSWPCADRCRASTRRPGCSSTCASRRALIEPTRGRGADAHVGRREVAVIEVDAAQVGASKVGLLQVCRRRVTQAAAAGRRPTHQSRPDRGRRGAGRESCDCAARRRSSARGPCASGRRWVSAWR